MTDTCDKCKDTGYVPCGVWYCTDDDHIGICYCPAGDKVRAELENTE